MIYRVCTPTHIHTHRPTVSSPSHVHSCNSLVRDVLCTQLTGAMRFKSLFKFSLNKCLHSFFQLHCAACGIFSSLTRDQTCTAPMGSAELQPLDSQGSSSNCLCSRQLQSSEMHWAGPGVRLLPPRKLGTGHGTEF